MSGGPITESDLLAYVDGRLSSERRGEIRAQLSGDPVLAACVAAYEEQNSRLRDLYAPVLAETVPQQMVNAAQRVQRIRAAGAVAGWLILGATGGVLAGLWMGWSMRAPVPVAATPVAPLELVRTAAVAHATYTPEVRHPVEVAADQEAHLVAWLSKRLGAPVRAPRLASEGLELVGGRLLPGEIGPHGATPTAQFMYQCPKGRRVTLYVRTEGPDHEETAFRYAREGSVSVFYWIDRRFGYALSSSDMEKDELLKLANVAYRQLNP